MHPDLADWITGGVLGLSIPAFLLWAGAAFPLPPVWRIFRRSRVD